MFSRGPEEPWHHLFRRLAHETWMLMGMIALPACEVARKGQKDIFLDKQIALQAAAEGKPGQGAGDARGTVTRSIPSRWTST